MWLSAVTGWTRCPRAWWWWTVFGLTPDYRSQHGPVQSQGVCVYITHAPLLYLTWCTLPSLFSILFWLLACKPGTGLPRSPRWSAVPSDELSGCEGSSHSPPCTTPPTYMHVCLSVTVKRPTHACSLSGFCSQPVFDRSDPVWPRGLSGQGFCYYSFKPIGSGARTTRWFSATSQICSLYFLLFLWLFLGQAGDVFAQNQPNSQQSKVSIQQCCVQGFLCCYYAWVYCGKNETLCARTSMCRGVSM